jgi:hypothetical protein
VEELIFLYEFLNMVILALLDLSIKFLFLRRKFANGTRTAFTTFLLEISLQIFVEAQFKRRWRT